MFSMPRFLIILPAALLIGNSYAADPKSKADVPPPPPIPKTGQYVDDPAAIEPEVRIVPKKDGTYEEYRINGQLYKVKVTPKKGKPYYLFDPRGDGSFQRSDLEPKIAIPMWVIKEF
jgi:hypothetical protein